MQETFKNSMNPTIELVKCSTIDMQSKEKFRTIAANYQALIATQI